MYSSRGAVGVPKPGPCVWSTAPFLEPGFYSPGQPFSLPCPYRFHCSIGSPSEVCEPASGQRDRGTPRLRLRRLAFCPRLPRLPLFSLLPSLSTTSSVSRHGVHWSIYWISIPNVLTLFHSFPPQDTILSPFHQLCPRRFCAQFLFPNSWGSYPSLLCPPSFTTGVCRLSFIPLTRGSCFLPGSWPCRRLRVPRVLALGNHV